MNEVDNKVADLDARLGELVTSAVNALANTGVARVVNKEMSEKAQFNIGEVMDKATKLLDGNKKEFGKWRDDNIVGNGKHSVNKRTLTRWVNLPKFEH